MKRIQWTPSLETTALSAIALAFCMALSASASADTMKSASELEMTADQSQQAYMERQRKYRHVWSDKISKAFRPKPEMLETGAGKDDSMTDEPPGFDGMMTPPDDGDRGSAY